MTVTAPPEAIERLARPTPALIEQVADWGDVVVLGAGGKMGVGIVGMLAAAFRAAGSTSRVHAVSRWRDPDAVDRLRAVGAVPVVADAADPDALAGLPDADRVVFLVGAKFGTADAPYAAWMTNTVLPARVAERYRAARIVALSTGNVYPALPAASGGADETTAPAPIGDYAMSCLGRERVFQHAAREHGTRVAIIRLNYACEPRYGVIADIGRRVHAGEPVDLAVGSVNIVDQRYANEVVLRSLELADAPEFVLNLAGPETASVAWIARRLGELLDTEPVLVGEPGGTALLSNAARCHGRFGYPELGLDALLVQQAEWLRSGGELWAKPTKFERTDGKF